MKVYSDPKITSSILVSLFLIAGISGRPAPEPWEPYSEMDFDTAFKGAKGFGELGWGGVQMAVPMMQKMFKDKKEEVDTKYFPKKVIKAGETSDSSEESGEKAKKAKKAEAESKGMEALAMASVVAMGTPSSISPPSPPHL